ncbi:hypothetical protein L6164_021200 [Bauhinia variegata]|uniref:Uncharacterized protein n=1 Tax=Bauhinia variegata TaxID=167791 RepID=A0ACB9MZI7_BAUVA|nr:hypothetical protein L6164_021200 [Bauhinia variegata]
MAFFRASVEVLAIYVLVFAIISLAAVESQTLSPGPAPGPSSDGTSIDQGIAYVLMLVALLLTYLIHPLNASSFNL